MPGISMGIDRDDDDDDDDDDEEKTKEKAVQSARGPPDSAIANCQAIQPHTLNVCGY